MPGARAAANPDRQPRLLDQVRTAIRVRHLSHRTERAYVGWVRRFILFHGKRHPREMGAMEIAVFLSHLAENARVSPSTQNQALNGILFLYREVLRAEVGPLHGVVRAKRRRRLPVVLSREEVQALLGEPGGTHRLVATFLYGAGLRLRECLALRVKDLDFDYGQITLRDTKGRFDRITMLPAKLESALRQQLGRVRAGHRQDLEQGYGTAPVPYALARKYPSAPADPGWQFIFPSSKRSVDRRTGRSTASISVPVASSAPCVPRGAVPASTSRPAATPCATPSPPTCSRTDKTYAPSRNCWATRASRRR